MERRKNIPVFNTAEEEGEFWENHSAASFQLVLVDPKEVLEELKVRHREKKNVTFRLEPDLLRRLKAQAKSFGIKYQTFIRAWLWRAVS